MTNYNERLDKILDNLVFYACEYEAGKDVYLCAETWKAKQAITPLVKELVAEAKRESHKSGYIQAIADFSRYYMDASIPAQRNLTMPDIAIELTENYKYPQNLLKALEES